MAKYLTIFLPLVAAFFTSGQEPHNCLPCIAMDTIPVREQRAIIDAAVVPRMDSFKAEMQPRVDSLVALGDSLNRVITLQELQLKKKL